MTTLRRLAAPILAVAGGLVALVAAGLVLAGPASAEPAVGWEDAPPESTIRAVLILGGIPLGLFLLLALMIYLPALVRGERVAPGAAPVDNQWLGGPRRTVGELAGPDTEKSEAGGAGARW